MKKRIPMKFTDPKLPIFTFTKFYCLLLKFSLVIRKVHISRSINTLRCSLCINNINNIDNILLSH